MNTHVTMEGAGARVVLAGDFDTLAAQELDATFASLLARVEGDLAVDLAEVTYLNSTGIRSFLRLDTLLRSRGQRLELVNAPRRIQRVFSYCGLDGFFVFTHTITEGVPA